MLTFDHSVKVDGKWFKAGEPIDFPVLTPTKQAEPTVTVDTEEKAEVKVEKPAPAKKSYTKRK